ncbi:MAG TPA: glycosyltransferase family 1 protein [Candidatus Dormibacteraeota bacterium]|nr:glycosyltransferase family 1 protein [Candidatus Dormibacteraeota bacterium]
MTGIHVAVDGYGLSRPRAGVGVYTREILHAMAVDRPDCRMTVFLPEGAARPDGAPSIAYRNLPNTRLVGRHIQWPARVRALRANAFFGPAGSLPLRDVGAPTVITVHDLAIYRNREWFPAGQPLSTGWIVPRSLRRADRLIAVSQNTKRDIEAIFDVPASRITVVPEAVSNAFRPLPPEDLRDVRAKLALPERFILFVSTIEPRKNLTTLLDAWAMMRDRPALVVVGGWGWRYEPIRARMERLGPGLHHIQGLDPSDLPAVYNLALALAHPAWYEGFGLPPLEAMACGTPAIVSDRSSLPEVVGEAGLIVPADDTAAWTRALEAVAGDGKLANELRRRGILRAAEFSWARSAEMTWRAIESAIER